jgi:hypothetical protein
MPDLVLALVSIALWLVVLISDLHRRRIAVPVLLALLFVSLSGRPWPWWLIIFAMILAPRRWLVGLAPIGLGIGLFMNDLASGLALTLGVWAWVMRWWAGADAIVLVALTLRLGWSGLLVGLSALLMTAMLVFLKRRQSPLTLWLAVQEAAHLQPRTETEIPIESELPAAATLAAVGIVLEVVQLVSSGALRS